MIGSKQFVSYLICFFATLICFTISLENKNNSIGAQISAANLLNSDTSHELMHSQNDNTSAIVKPTDSSSNETIGLGVTQGPHKTIKRILNDTEKHHSSIQTDGKVIAAEGGTFPVSSISNNKTALDNNTHSSTIASKNQSLSSTILPGTTAVGKKISTIPTLSISTSTAEPKSRTIHHGANNYSPKTPSPSPLYSSASPATTKKHKKKPIFTMVPSDEDASDSFIESSTTGRDYVLPIVLCILALPLVGFITKLIYRRGTEFTERQQYHRMYLIDGMYNSR